METQLTFDKWLDLLFAFNKKRNNNKRITAKYINNTEIVYVIRQKKEIIIIIKKKKRKIWKRKANVCVRGGRLIKVDALPCGAPGTCHLGQEATEIDKRRSRSNLQSSLSSSYLSIPTNQPPRMAAKLYFSLIWPNSLFKNVHLSKIPGPPPQ